MAEFQLTHTFETPVAAEPTATLNVDGRSLTTRLLFALVIGASFFAVDHSFDASDRVLRASEFEESENVTADRVEAVSLITSVSRIGFAMFAAICIALGARGTRHQNGVLHYLMLTYFLFLAASLVWSVEQDVTFHKIVVLALCVWSAFGISRYLSLHDFLIVTSWICVGFIGIGIVSELVHGNFKPYLRGYRFIGTSHPNTQAAYAVIVCLASPIFSRHAKSFNLWTVVFFAIGFATLLLTRSRTSLAGMVVAIIAIRTVTLKPTSRTFVISFSLFVAVIGGFVLALARSSSLTSVNKTLAMGRTKDLSTLTGRLPLWEELLSSVEKHPIVGHGYLAYWTEDQVQKLSTTFNWEIPHGHNLYIDLLLDGGLIGIMLFVSIVLTGLVVSVTRYSATRDIGAAFIFGLLLFVVIHGVGESLFKHPTYLFFILVTAILCFDRTPIGTSENVEEEPPPTMA